MIESSLTSLSRPSPSLLSRDNMTTRRRPLGFEVTEEEKEYKIAVHVPDVDANDINLQLDNDGRVLRLKGDRSLEAGGMRKYNLVLRKQSCLDLMLIHRS